LRQHDAKPIVFPNFLSGRAIMSHLQRITLDPDICHGKPCVRHMRWPVEVVLDLIASGMSVDEILADHPELERDDVTACLQYARLLVSGEPTRQVA
jgi:uncharacterized protein (DUF433 family)